MSKYYTVYSKPDDYGGCKTELIETSPEHAAEYYNFKEVDKGDIDVLRKYLGLVDKDEESDRSSDRRYYGSDW